MEQRKRSFWKSTEEVKSVHKSIDRMEDAVLQKQAKNIQDIYKKRYASFSKINDSYRKINKNGYTKEYNKEKLIL